MPTFKVCWSIIQSNLQKWSNTCLRLIFSSFFFFWVTNSYKKEPVQDGHLTISHQIIKNCETHKRRKQSFIHMYLFISDRLLKSSFLYILSFLIDLVKNKFSHYNFSSHEMVFQRNIEPQSKTILVVQFLFSKSE